MRTPNENKRPRIGFKYWNNEDDNFIETPTALEGINTINTVVESEKVQITATHGEVLERLAMVEAIILGKGFAKLSKKKKLEFLAEQNFLKGLNEQLNLSYKIN